MAIERERSGEREQLTLVDRHVSRWRERLKYYKNISTFSMISGDLNESKHKKTANEDKLT